jgi:GDP/UDP-N,N'-diacetylbacillosamine 2-epimerase (hydrolysing)
VEILPETDTLAAMAVSVGKGIIGMVEAFECLKPDIVLILGDRTEPLAAAIASAYMNIPVAHIHGGDACKGGNIDDSNRFAITKFAHLHFPATAKSTERLIRLGEEKWRVHQVGSPALDVILNEPLPPTEEIIDKFSLDPQNKLIIIIQHPVTVQVEKAAIQMRETLEAVVESGYPAVVIYPNSDAGSRQMIDVIREYKKSTSIKAFQNLPRHFYLGLLAIADVMVGNSSSGIIDAPSFNLPVVNIGIRQEGRERGSNVIDVDHEKSTIMAAIDKAVNDTKFKEKIKNSDNPYGDGKASRRIVDILKGINITPELLQKKITY